MQQALSLGGTDVFLQGRGSLEDDIPTGRPQTVRIEHKFQEVATLVVRSKNSD